METKVLPRVASYQSQSQPQQPQKSLAYYNQRIEELQVEFRYFERFI